jgi:transposase-like protein
LHDRQELIWNLDGTGSVSSSRFTLVTLTATNEAGECIPVAWMICQSENHESIKRFISKVAQHVGYLPRRIMIDKAGAAMKAIDAIAAEQSRAFPDEPDFDYMLCWFHVMQAIQRWSDDLHRHIPAHVRTVVKQSIRSMQQAGNPAELATQWRVLSEWLAHHGEVNLEK